MKEATAAKKKNAVIFFAMRFLFIYCDDIDDLTDAGEYEIRVFWKNGYIRKSWRPTTADINKFLIAIADCYKFLYQQGLLSEYSLAEIKEVCKDKE